MSQGSMSPAADPLPVLAGRAEPDPVNGRGSGIKGERPKGTFLFDGKGRGDTFRRDADRA
jgi:hypothetical protein